MKNKRTTKTLIILTALFLYQNGVQSQIKEGMISYDYWNYYGQNFRENLEEMKKEFEEDGMGQSFGDIDKFMDKITEDTRGDSVAYLYIYFNAFKARRIFGNKDMNKKFSYYNLNDLSSYTLYLKDGKCKIDTISMNYRVNPDWDVKYDVDKNFYDRKEILGYDCFKVTVKEEKRVKGKLSVHLSELYVTDEIKFPSHFICGWYDHVIDECAMEIKSWIESEPESYDIYSVRNIEKGLPDQVFDLPEKCN